MIVVKLAGCVWGLIYFVIGTIFSFTLGGKEFWSGATVYLALFLLPLPISILAVWFSKTAGYALLVCAAVSIAVSFATVVSTGALPDLVGISKFAMFHVPHIVFAVAYFTTGRVSTDAGSGQSHSSQGA